MKSPWVRMLLFLVSVFVGWCVLLFVYAMLTPDDPAGLDRFTGPALILSCAIVAIIALVNGYIQTSNRIFSLRTAAEAKKQQIENEKIELENSIQKVMAFLTFFYRESAKQSPAKLLLESLSSMLLRSSDSMVSTQEILKAIVADQSMRSNPEVQQMIAQITGKEASIRQAKQEYNNAVRSYNSYLSSFPASLLAATLSAVPLDYHSENAGLL